MAKLYKYSINLLILITVIISTIFFFNFNKGLELSDESYLLLISMYPNDIIGRANNSGVIGNILLQLANNNLYFFRILGGLLLILSSFVLINPISNFLKNKLYIKNFANNYILLTLLLGSLNYYHNWVITPSYDLYNLIGILLFLSGILKIVECPIKNLNFLISILLVVLGGLISFISKPTSAFFLIFIYFIWIVYFLNFKELLFRSLFIIILSIVSFYLYILFYFENIYLYLNDLKIGIELKVLLDPRYSLIDNFISIIKQILFYYYSNIFLISFVLIFLLLSKFFLKSKFKNIAFILTFLPLFFIDNLLLSLLFIVLIYLITIIDSSKISKLSKTKKNNLFYIFILIFLLYSYLVGTNTNAVVLLKKASLIIFLIFLCIILNLESSKKLLFRKVNIFFIILIFFTLKNLFYNFEKPRRLHDNIYNQTKAIKLKNFNGEIYIDEITFNFINELNQILQNNQWKNGDYMIDFTGREPGLNVITGGKFVIEPWWGSGYIGSEKKAKKLLSMADLKIIKNSWIISTNHKININPKILNNLKLSLQKDYKLIGTVKKKR